MRGEAHVEVCAIQSAEEAAADGGQHGTHAGNLSQLLLDLERDFLGRAQPRAFNGDDSHVEFTFVHIAREIFLTDELIQRHG